MASEDIIPGITPTRMQLLALKERRGLADKGYQLLSEKLEALTNELLSAVVEYREMISETQKSVKRSMKKLDELETQIGEFLVYRTALTYPKKYIIDSEQITMMGVHIPTFKLKKIPRETIPYSLSETSILLDHSLLEFENSLKAIIRLAEKQSLIQRLANEISETKRRVNALNYIIIPRLDATINWIKLTLDERERESFVRLKKVKKRIAEKKKQQ